MDEHANRTEKDMACPDLLDLSEEFRACQKVFSAIGDITRQQIIVALLESDWRGIRVGEIIKKTYLSRPAVSHHIKTLIEAGIIGKRQEGTMNYYYIAYSVSELRKVEMLFHHIRLLLEEAMDQSKTNCKYD